MPRFTLFVAFFGVFTFQWNWRDAAAPALSQRFIALVRKKVFYTGEQK